jgi:hypothetical protein
MAAYVSRPGTWGSMTKRVGAGTTVLATLPLVLVLVLVYRFGHRYFIEGVTAVGVMGE